jgi:hypothetical protein
LNQIIAEAHDELIGTAYARATGYLQADEETESGYQEDATGRPIRHAVSDRLAIALVNANQKAQLLLSPVNININLAAMGITQSNAKLQQLPSNVVDGQFREEVGVEAEEAEDVEDVEDAEDGDDAA